MNRNIALQLLVNGYNPSSEQILTYEGMITKLRYVVRGTNSRLVIMSGLQHGDISLLVEEKDLPRKEHRLNELIVVVEREGHYLPGGERIPINTPSLILYSLSEWSNKPPYYCVFHYPLPCVVSSETIGNQLQTPFLTDKTKATVKTPDSVSITCFDKINDTDELKDRLYEELKKEVGATSLDKSLRRSGSYFYLMRQNNTKVAIEFRDGYFDIFAMFGGSRTQEVIRQIVNGLNIKGHLRCEAHYLPVHIHEEDGGMTIRIPRGDVGDVVEFLRRLEKLPAIHPEPK